VWLECRALTSAGYRVAVVCPKGPGDPAFAQLEGVDLYKYTPRGGGRGPFSFFVEYVYSFLATLWLTLKASRSGRFDAIQSCNPPDIFWPIGLLFRALHGSSFVFDHHDLCPELFDSRFPGGAGFLRTGLLRLERATMRSADHVISTNESYRSVAIDRHGRDPDTVTVVRTGPDSSRLSIRDPQPELRRGRDHLVAYIGVMGPQDGVDNVLKAASVIVKDLGCDNISFTLIGSGDCLDELVQLRSDLALDDVVHFTGRIPDREVSDILSTADIGLCPDPKNPLNDVSTMNKTMEYMAFGLPVVAFDLRETRFSAGEGAVYARPNEVEDFARLIVELLGEPERRRAMGEFGRHRVLTELAWSHQAPSYVAIYDSLTGRPTATIASEAT
jgi:glycosyltransferase involved in cell wall biosynthesis